MPTDDGSQAPHWIRRASPSVLVSWVAARVLVAISYPIATAIAPHVDLPVGRRHLHQGLLYWDGAYYRRIAEQGYTGAGRDVVRFFPLYPELSGALGDVLGGRADVALVVVANVAALVAVFLMWRLVVELGYDEAVAGRAVVLVTLFPAASTFAYGYSEGLFLLCLMAAAIAITRRRPWLAVGPLVALGLTRPTGVLLSAVVVVAAVVDFGAAPDRRRDWRVWSGWGAATLAPVAGLVGYLVWLEDRLGLGSAPLDVQRELRAGFREPISRLGSAVWSTVTGDFVDVYNLAFAAAAVAAIVIAIRRRLPLVWTVYLVIGVLVASSANNIGSMGRYVLLLAPALPLAWAVALRQRAAFAAAVGVCSVGLVWFTVVTALGLVVP